MDRTTSQGLRLSQSGADLIGDIHRRQRRRLLRRAAQLTLLAVVLLAAGLAVKAAADSRARTRALGAARAAFARGTVVELRAAAEALGRHLAERGSDPAVAAALALVQAQLFVEFGEQGEAAMATVAGLPEDLDLPDARWARALLALAADDLPRARTLSAPASPEDAPTAPGHDLYVRGLWALATGPDAVGKARAALAGIGNDGPASHQRLQIRLEMASGDGEQALAHLSAVRERHRAHMGLAADEALYHAYLRRELSGVADVADQLLATDGTLLSTRDRQIAQLARATVLALGGDRARGLDRIRDIFPALPPWRPIARQLAIRTMLEAGAADEVAEWLEDARLSATDSEIYRAWIELVRGDAASSLARLGKLPQALPRVAYLQGLALVTQHRFAEAKPWIDRAMKLLPGRPELEVAAARIELHQGDPKAARRKLETLVQEESHAPGVLTALGEAYLEQAPPLVDQARRTLERALEEEPRPAEAAFLLARLLVENARSAKDEQRALLLLERAVEANPYLPRYRWRLARAYADLGRLDEALETAAPLLETPGASPQVAVDLARWQIARAERLGKQQDLEEARARIARAEADGAEKTDVAVVRAALALAEDDRTTMAAAADELAEVTQKEPLRYDGWMYLARLRAAIGDRTAAEKTLRLALSHLPDEDSGPIHLVWAQLDARRGIRRKAAARARVAWARLLRAQADPALLVEAAETATRLWLRLRKPKSALVIARQLTDRVPNRADAWLLRAQVELGANRALEARTSAERAVELDGDDPLVHAVLGHTLLRFGHKARARRAYEQAVELARGTSLEARMRENLRRL